MVCKKGGHVFLRHQVLRDAEIFSEVNRNVKTEPSLSKQTKYLIIFTSALDNVATVHWPGKIEKGGNCELHILEQWSIVQPCDSAGETSHKYKSR